MRIDEAGVGQLELALPGVGSVGVVGDGSGEDAGGGDLGGDARAGDAEPVKEGRRGKAGGGDFDGGVGGVADFQEAAREGERGWSGGTGGRPAAVNVFEGVKVGGGGGEALEVGVERFGGYEVGAAASGDLDAGLDGAVADGSLSVGGEDEIAAEVGVATEEKKAGLTERDVAPNALKANGDVAEGVGASEGSIEGEDASVGDVGVGAGGAGA